MSDPSETVGVNVFERTSSSALLCSQSYAHAHAHAHVDVDGMYEGPSVLCMYEDIPVALSLYESTLTHRITLARKARRFVSFRQDQKQKYSNAFQAPASRVHSIFISLEVDTALSNDSSKSGDGLTSQTEP